MRTSFTTQTPRYLFAACLGAACTATLAADVFAPPGTKATLSVDYVYESAGKKRSEGMYDPYEWRVKRSMRLTADLAAQPATAMPAVQAIDAAQMAGLKGMTTKMQSVQQQMAPMMADVQKIMAKCGDDEACMTREAEKMGSAMAGTPKMAAAMNAKKGIDELSRQDGPRYQAWRPTAQKGTYLIDETVHVASFDMACPRQRCIRDETRKGSGEVALPPEAKAEKGAAAGISAAELDAGKSTLTLVLPVPLHPLTITETITSDDPGSGAPRPKGPQQKLYFMRTSAKGTMNTTPLTVPLKGGWRSQSGEQVVKLDGNFGDGGTLVVRWRFAVQ